MALFVAVAVILGGGGSPGPSTELLLELAFAVAALAWLWISMDPAENAFSRDRLVVALMAFVLIVPIVQLVPLPPSIWTHLPGRANEVAALSLVGDQQSWRPITLSPARTLASLLASLPPLFCLYAVSRLALHERRLVLGSIVLMAVVTSMLGVLQLTDQGQGLSLYREHSAGWVQGFQANRNAAADLLLIGIIALTVIVAPYFRPGRLRAPLRLDRRTFTILSSGIGVLLLIATVMTGSRTGTALILVAAAAALIILLLDSEGAGQASRWKSILLGFAALALLGVAFAVLAKYTALGQVTGRFAEKESRTEIWQDAWFALKQYWPAGFGMGGFQSAILPAERLEVLDPQIPNRAHNDYLEIGLEAGVLGLAMLAMATLACLAMIWRSWRQAPAQRQQVVFGTAALLTIALHSVVDYPLRSMAIACLTGIAAGMLTREPKSDAGQARGRSNQVKGLA